MPDAFVRLAVIGDPIEHSRSPELHRAFLREAGISGSYERLLVHAGDGAAAIDRLRSHGYLGANVTTPLKEEAFASATRHDAAALATGSVNTLLFGDTIAGFNTDGIGTIGVLRDAGLDPVEGAKVLVLGAGPTARSAVAALLEARARVWIWNRTPERALQAAVRLGARVFGGDDATSFDAIFSALPPHAKPDDDPLTRAVLEAPIFVDANYGGRATLAAELGRSGNDGSRMLEYSARASFELWRAYLLGGTPA